MDEMDGTEQGTSQPVSSSGRWILALVLVALLAAALAGSGVYVWQASALKRAELQAAQAEAERSALASRVAGLESEVRAIASASAATDATATGGGTSGASGSSNPSKPPASSSSEQQTAYITKITDAGEANYRFTVDYVQLLTGQAAAKAYEEDHPGQELDGDFYIRNQNPQLRTFPVSADAKLYLIDLSGASPALKKVGADVFQSAVTHEAKYKTAPFRLTIQGGKVVKAEEIYTP